jgi:hypothetical protein
MTFVLVFGTERVRLHFVLTKTMDFQTKKAGLGLPFATLRALRRL